MEEKRRTSAALREVFPFALDTTLRRMEGKQLLIRHAHLMIASDHSWYVVVTQRHYVLRRLNAPTTRYFKLHLDVFGIVSGVEVGQPPLSMAPRHWHDITRSVCDFPRWHYERLLPLLHNHTGYDRAIVTCSYFAPRGIDDPCDHIKKANGYEGTSRARRDKLNSELAASRRDNPDLPSEI